MSDRLPVALLDALTDEERAGLQRFLDVLGPELASLYEDEVADHSEARGDNGQLFGMKVWVHGWFRYEERFSGDATIKVVSEKGSWSVRIGRLRIGIYRQGGHIDDDVNHEIPHSDSETKRSYGENNAQQLALFDAEVGRPALDAEKVAALFDLTVTHFGNSRDGLVKWYMGAQSEPGCWGWVMRQPDVASPRWSDGDGGVTVLRPRDPRRPGGGGVVPFDERPVEDVSVEPQAIPRHEAQPEDIGE